MKQKKYWIRIAAAVLAAALVILLICIVRNGDGPHVTTEVITAEPTPDNPYDDKGFLKDTLPADLNYKNETVRVLTWSEHAGSDWNVTDSDPQVFAEAKTGQKTKVEERLGVRIAFDAQPGGWNSVRSFIDILKKSAQAGQTAYDLVCQYTPAAGVGMTGGLYTDLESADYPDLRKPWWPADESTCAVNGKVYAVTGDCGVSATEETFCILQNVTLGASVGIKSTEYDVNNKTWTLERMISMVKDAKLPDNPDRSSAYKLTLGPRETLDSLLYAGGTSFAVHTANGYFTLSESLSAPAFSAWMDTWLEFVNAPYSGEKNIWEKNGFAEGNVLFHLGKLSEIRTYLSGKDFTVLVLPFPLMNAEQSNYATVTGLWTSMYSIPASARNTEMSAAVLEALGSYGYRTLLPAWKKAVFAGNRLDHSGNTAMLQVLHNTLTPDAARLCATKCSGYSAARCIADGRKWSDTLAQSAAAWKAETETIR